MPLYLLLLVSFFLLFHFLQREYNHILSLYYNDDNFHKSESDQKQRAISCGYNWSNTEL